MHNTRTQPFLPVALAPKEVRLHRLGPHLFRKAPSR